MHACMHAHCAPACMHGRRTAKVPILALEQGMLERPYAMRTASWVMEHKQHIRCSTLCILDIEIPHLLLKTRTSGEELA